MRSASRSPSSRRGFTVIELLVVIAIIIILASLLVPAIGLLHRMALRSKTTHNMAMLSSSVSTYLDSYARLGALTDPTETDAQHSLAFRSDPWYFLFLTPTLTKAEPYFAPTGLPLVTATGAGVCVPATSPMTATHICDAFGNQAVNVLSWAIVNGSPLGSSDTFTFTQSIDMRSSAGTPNDITDDINFHYSSQTQRWDMIPNTNPWNNSTYFNEPLPSGSGLHP